MIAEDDGLSDGVNSMWINTIKKDDKWRIRGEGKVNHTDWATGQPNTAVS